MSEYLKYAQMEICNVTSTPTSPNTALFVPKFDPFGHGLRDMKDNDLSTIEIKRRNSDN